MKTCLFTLIGLFRLYLGTARNLNLQIIIISLLYKEGIRTFRYSQSWQVDCYVALELHNHYFITPIIVVDYCLVIL